MSDGEHRPKRRRGHRHPSKRAKVKDVALAAGVSVATVSRALNRTGRFSPETLQRVRKAANQLGYVPHGAARALASRRSRAFGAIVPTLENLNFALCAEAIQQRAIEARYHLLVASTGYDPSRELAHVQDFAAHGVDGIVLVGAQRDREVLEFLRAREIPYVVTWVLADPGTPSVGFDNAEAARRLARHLLDLGHRQIGVIAGLVRNNDRAAARLEGVRRALADRGLALPQELLIERPYRIAEGQLAMRALMTAPTPPTAVICGNDQLAFGALLECGRRGISVPGDVSIAGFDDLEFASQIRPALTTIHVPAEQIGQRAADYLLARAAGAPVATTTEVPVNLIVRESTAPPPATRLSRPFSTLQTDPEPACAKQS
jgi:LacI family transcriptional regulator